MPVHADTSLPTLAKAIGALLLVLAAVGLAVWRMQPGAAAPSEAPVLTEAGDAVAGLDRFPEPAAAGPSPPPSPSTRPQVVVHLIGPVVRPGVLTLPAGSRVADAVAAAGGFQPGQQPPVNLARLLVDGEQIDVSAVGAAPTAAGESAPAGPLDLNTATLEQLDALPGVGPVMAQKILDHRQVHGRFASVEQLGEVPGIGDKRLADLRDLVRAG